MGVDKVRKTRLRLFLALSEALVREKNALTRCNVKVQTMRELLRIAKVGGDSGPPLRRSTRALCVWVLAKTHVHRWWQTPVLLA